MAQQLAAELRQQGVSAAVINPRFVKPLDRDLIADYARRVGVIVTLEDHVLMGGFGSAVLEALSDMQIGSAGSPHRLARPFYRARQSRSIARQVRHQCRSRDGKAGALSAAPNPQAPRRPLSTKRRALAPVLCERTNSTFPSFSKAAPEAPAAFSADRQTTPVSASSSPARSPVRRAGRKAIHTPRHR